MILEISIMAARSYLILFSLTLFFALWGPSSAQSNSGNGCSTALISLLPCLNYVTGNSSSPTTACCTQLSGVIQSEPQCLCTLINGGSVAGFTINQTLALALPGACNLQTPSASGCNGTNSNGGAPSNSPPGGQTPPAGEQSSPPNLAGSGPSPPSLSAGGEFRGAKFGVAGALFMTGVLLSLGGTGFT